MWLKDFQLQFLKSSICQTFIESKRFSVQDILKFTYDQTKNILSEKTLRLVQTKKRTLKQVINFTWQQRANIESPLFNQLCEIKEVGFDRALNLTPEQRKTLESRQIKVLMRLGLSITAALKIDHSLRNLIESFSIEPVRRHLVSMDKFLKLTWEEKRNLDTPNVIPLIDANILSLKEAVMLTARQRALVSNTPLASLIIQGKIDIKVLFGLEYLEQQKFLHPRVQSIIQAENFKAGDLLSMDKEFIKFTFKRPVNRLIKEKKVSIKELSSLDFNQLKRTEKELGFGFYHLIAAKFYTVQELLDCTSEQLQRFKYPSVISLIELNKIQPKHFFALTDLQRKVFMHIGMHKLIQSDHVRFEQLNLLSENACHQVLNYYEDLRQMQGNRPLSLKFFYSQIMRWFPPSSASTAVPSVRRLPLQ